MDKNTKENISLPLLIYFCGREQCAPAHFWGPAIRPHYLIHFIMSGEGIFQRKNQTYHLKAGDAFLISPLESTFYQADEKNPWNYIWVGFDGKDIDSILKSTCFGQTCIYQDCENFNKKTIISKKVTEILNAFQKNQYGPLYLMGSFLELLGIMNPCNNLLNEESSHQYLIKAKDYIQNNYSYNIRISDIASFIGIDRTYLYRIFKENEHISPKQYLFQLRLRTATNMLRNMQYTITEIAYSCGFQDASAFCNCFKKSTGFTPRQFRIELENEIKGIQ